MYKQALQKAQGVDNKKVGFNLQIPNNLKFEFEQQCKKDNVTVTSMIISLMEVSLVESYIASAPKIEKAFSDFKRIVNSDDIFLPNPVSHSHPMYVTTLSDDDFKKLMEIDLELSISIYEFEDEHHIIAGLENDYSYKSEVYHLVERARSYIRRIATNMDKRDEYNAVQEKFMNFCFDYVDNKSKKDDK